MLSVQLTRTGGPDPSTVVPDEIRRVELVVVKWSLELEAELVKATPVGIGGNLKQAWSHTSAKTPDGFVVQVTNSAKYLLSVELGRLPGKGISLDGQAAVELWAKRKLGLSDPQGFGYLLSRKYKLEGRPAQGFIGLALPGSKAIARSGSELPPIPGGLLATAFKRLDSSLS